MKNLLMLIIISLIFIACDNQILDPNYDDNLNLDKRGSPENIVPVKNEFPGKSYKSVDIKCRYTFNPQAPENDCGGFLNNCNTDYSYENERERRIRNLEIYSPSKLWIDGKVHNTINIYTINKYELLSEKGALVSGSTWGTFKIHLVEDDINVDENMGPKYGKVAENPLKDLGPLLIKGRFEGSINGKNTKITLRGKGADIFEGSRLAGAEEMLCGGGKHCWKSKISGKIKKVEFVDE